MVLADARAFSLVNYNNVLHDHNAVAAIDVSRRLDGVEARDVKGCLPHRHAVDATHVLPDAIAIAAPSPPR